MDNAISKQRNQKLLTKVERIALKTITGCMPSTPTIPLNQITNIPTIIQFIEGEAAKGHLRLQATKQLTPKRPTKTEGTIISHTYQNFNYINTLKLPQGENDMMKKRLNLNLRFKTIISNRDQIAEYLKSIKDEDITCYTDGSKIETQTGYGYRISKNNNTITINEESGRMPSHCTVYQAECPLTALYTKQNVLSLHCIPSRMSSHCTVYQAECPLTALYTKQNVLSLYTLHCIPSRMSSHCTVYQAECPLTALYTKQSKEQ